MREQTAGEAVLFKSETLLGFRVQTTVRYWEIITTIKHQAIQSREEAVRLTLATSDEVRLSQRDNRSIYSVVQTDIGAGLCGHKTIGRCWLSDQSISDKWC